MAEELNAASVLVVSSPMWNFSFPYVLKQYIDIAVQPGINFKELPGAPAAASDATRPITWDKHLVLVTSRGGSFGHNNPRDHFGLYLRYDNSLMYYSTLCILKCPFRDIFGMLGFTRAHEVAMEGAMTSPKAALLERAAGDAQMVADILNAEFAQWNDDRKST